MINRTKSDIEIEKLVSLKREELMADFGIGNGEVDHYKMSESGRVSQSEKGKTTLVFLGLTELHRQLIQASMLNLGYKVVALGEATKSDFQAGKEYGNNGMCSPAYFVTGQLINYLEHLRDEEGLSTEEIIRDYAFVNSGACGPCRFGMYEAEHAVTLRNSGFEGFRTIFFEQKSGLAQAKDDEGLSFNEYFFLSFLNSALAGDALNDLTSQIRPYEVEAGMTNKAMSNVLERMRECMRSKEYHAWEGSVSAKILDKLIKDANPSQLEKVLDQLFSDHYLSALRDCAQIINNEIEVDYAQPKVSCKIVGEFWAQMAEGEGNFNMFAFLESNGAEVIIEPIINWLAYLLEIASFKTADAGEVWDPDLGKWDVTKKMSKEYQRRLRLVLLKTFSTTMKREFNRIRKALGGIPRPICPQREVRKLSEPYFNKNIMGGEGYLEIGKTIYYSTNNLAHLILGLKPFGCLPSTQSDAAMVAVTAQYPEILYLPLETSGEGDINAYSRVQMILTEAKKRAREEFNDCVHKTGYSIEEIREYCCKHRELRKPLQKIPRHDGVTGRGANFVLHVGKLMRKR